MLAGMKRSVRWVIALVSACWLSLGCDDNDQAPPAGSSGAAGDNAGMGGAGSAGGAAANLPPCDGGVCPPRLIAPGVCELGPVSAGCEFARCPALADALEDGRIGLPTVVVSAACQAADGRALISVATDWSGVVGGSHVYDATTGELLSVELNSDETNYCDRRAGRGVYGEYFESCIYPALYPRIRQSIPASCGDTPPAGSTKTPEECVFVLDAADAGP